MAGTAYHGYLPGRFGLANALLEPSYRGGWTSSCNLASVISSGEEPSIYREPSEVFRLASPKLAHTFFKIFNPSAWPMFTATLRELAYSIRSLIDAADGQV
jgi:hypothetical protein